MPPLRVLDLSQNLAGPFCAQILGDLGAEVIKVEPPGGDPARAWGPPFWGGQSPLFLAANRNKRSLVLDLKQEEGRAVLRRLIGDADVFLQALRAGAIERLGFGYPAVKALKPDIVYVSVTAFGPDGPLKNHPGYDPLMQAYSGLMSITGYPESPPARVGASVIDLGTGVWTALGVLEALRRRERTGDGTHVTSSLLDTALGWVSYHMMGYLADGAIPGRRGSGIGMIVPYGAYPTSDGHLMIAAGNDGSFRRLCEALEMDDEAADPRFATNPSRVAHRDEIDARITERTQVLTTAQLQDRLARHSVPAAPIHDVAEVVADEQVAATNVFRPTPHPEIDGYRDVALPLRWDGERPPTRRVPPSRGEHTDEVLAEAGYSAEDVARMRDAGIVG